MTVTSSGLWGEQRGKAMVVTSSEHIATRERDEAMTVISSGHSKERYGGSHKQSLGREAACTLERCGAGSK